MYVDKSLIMMEIKAAGRRLANSRVINTLVYPGDLSVLGQLWYSLEYSNSSQAGVGEHLPTAALNVCPTSCGST